MSAVIKTTFVGATPQLIASVVTGKGGPLILQGVDSFYVGLASAMSASTALLVASGAQFQPFGAGGLSIPLYAFSNGASLGASGIEQATIAITAWESLIS
jgi:hypothetical protein